ncbi:MAG: hypothetical protein JXO22_13760, partial [Phycisphaerae bacterium]|nr:hypothetical protein [Phycisphaerae bacterium]
GDLEGVAAEECSLLSAVTGGFAAVNIDQPLIRRHLPDGGVTIATFGRGDDADLRLSAARYEHPWLHFEVNGRFEYRLPMPGAHNAVNALGAIAIARRLGFEHEEIAERLSGLTPPPMRCEIVVDGELTVLNDSYNANPQSVLAALEMLLTQPCGGRRVAIIGEMRELGAAALRLHRVIAERLRDSSLDEIGLVGPAAELMSDVLRDDRPFGPNIERYASVADVAERLPGRLRPGDVVLLKGSRAVGLERLVEPVLRRGRLTPTG